MPKRIKSVDVARGIALLCMFIAHYSGFNFIPEIRCICSIFAAPFFLIVSGMSYKLYIQSREFKMVPQKELLIDSISRGLTIYVIPLFIYYFITLIGSGFDAISWIHWGIFQVIGISYIVGMFVGKNIRRSILCIIISFLTYSVILYFSISQLYFLVLGFSPIIPWISYFIFGCIISNIFFWHKNNIYDSTKKPSGYIIPFSVFATFISIILLDFFNISFTYLSRINLVPYMIICFTFLFIVTIIRFLEINGGVYYENISKPFGRIGKIAFSLYYLHLVVFYMVTIIVNHLEKFIQFNLLINLIYTIAFFGLFMVFSYIEPLWKKYNYKYGFEWAYRNTSIKFYSLFKYLQILG